MAFRRNAQKATVAFETWKQGKWAPFRTVAFCKSHSPVWAFKIRGLRVPKPGLWLFARGLPRKEPQSAFDMGRRRWQNGWVVKTGKILSGGGNGAEVLGIVIWRETELPLTRRLGFGMYSLVQKENRPSDLFLTGGSHFGWSTFYLALTRHPSAFSFWG